MKASAAHHQHNAHMRHTAGKQSSIYLTVYSILQIKTLAFGKLKEKLGISNMNGSNLKPMGHQYDNCFGR